jgi:tRNA-5-methyluridine54 2-sulfurtransferase
MNRLAREGGYDTLATDHNLDDEAATLFGNTINWLDDYLLIQSPVLDAAPGLIRKVKPLIRFFEREVAAYTLIQGFDYIQHECPFSTNSTSIQYKKILNQFEYNSPGTKQYFYQRFLKAKENGFFQLSNNKATDPQNLCPTCGQMTHASGQC